MGNTVLNAKHKGNFLGFFLTKKAMSYIRQNRYVLLFIEKIKGYGYCHIDFKI